MIKQREVKPEKLDELPSDHPDAIESRGDLRRLNWWMGNPRRLTKEIQARSREVPVQSVVDLGGGDGAVLLEMLEIFDMHEPEGLDPDRRPREKVVRLVDRHPCMPSADRKRLQERGWEVETIDAEVTEWLARSTEPVFDVIIANLFLHHFPTSALSRLLTAAASRCRCFIACEPLRCYRSLLLSKAICLIGCHPVTRHDASISVRAGFRGKELSALWPDHERWELREHAFGLASHHFVARFRGGHA